MGLETKMSPKKQRKNADAGVKEEEENTMKELMQEFDDATELGEDEIDANEHSDQTELPGIGYHPPKNVTFQITAKEWDEIDPENSGTALRKDQSRVLGPEWTNIFARYLAKANTKCLLIAAAGRCRRPDSRKHRSPYFTGSFFCKFPGCSVHYSLCIRAVPNPAENEAVMVECEGSGTFNHSKVDESIPPSKVTVVRKPKTPGNRLSSDERQERMRIKAQALRLRQQQTKRNRIIRAREYGLRSVKRPRYLKVRNHSSATAQPLQEEIMEDDEVYDDTPDEESFSQEYADFSQSRHNDVDDRRWRIPNRHSSYSVPIRRSANPALEAGEMELQALKIKYYKMKMYKTEMEIRQMDPEFDHRIFDEESQFAYNHIHNGAGFSSNYDQALMQDTPPARYVTII